MHYVRGVLLLLAFICFALNAFEISTWKIDRLRIMTAGLALCVLAALCSGTW
jgi:hypothetical protein